MSKEMWASMQERQRAPERVQWQFDAVAPWVEFGVVLPAALRNGDIGVQVYQHEGAPRFGAGIDATAEVVREMRAAARANDAWTHD